MANWIPEKEFGELTEQKKKVKGQIWFPKGVNENRYMDEKQIKFVRFWKQNIIMSLTQNL